RMRDDHAAALAAAASEKEAEIAKANSYLEALKVERIDGGVLKAVKDVGGVKDGALDDIQARARAEFEFDFETLQPVKFDGKGEDRAIVRGKDGKSPLSIAEWLEGIKKDGKKAGVWFEQPSGPKLPNRFSKSMSGEDLTSTQKIAAALRSRGVGG